MTKSNDAEKFSFSLMLSTKIAPLRFKTSGTFCSKMCVEALQQAEIVHKDVNSRLVTPSGLHAILTQPPPASDPHDDVVPDLDFAV
jgi:hypothetical protein